MSKQAMTWLGATVLAAAGAAGAFGQDTAAEDANDRSWPRAFTAGDGTAVLLYQPQLERWDDFRTLEALAAVSIRPAGSDTEVLGAITLTTSTAADHAARVVTLQQIDVKKMSFPGHTGEPSEETLEKLVRDTLPDGSLEVSLDLLLANLARSAVIEQPVTVSPEAPKIILHHSDAILVVVDGEPIYETIDDTDIGMVVNTASNVFRHDPSEKFYVLRDVHWLEAPALDGPWEVNRQLPEGFFKLPDNPRLREVRRKVRARSPGAQMDPPDVFVTTEPTALIVTFGPPELEPIEGTDLSFVTNTESDILKYGGDDLYYALLSGRWFRTAGKDAPLELCTSDLPDDFTRIPPDHAAGRVLVAVPGTPQAQEAVLGARIPRTATVRRADAKLEVSYEGEPAFVPIPGTDIEFAVNTSFDVLHARDRYYACDRAVWFVSDAPTGPWLVCDDVPEEIYEIPVTSPVFGLTYVFVYDANDEEVVVGYLPGYENVYVADDVIVYGLGYEYDEDDRYYSHRYRHWTARHFRYLRLRETYGHGYYYDHLSGRYRRSALARAHHGSEQIRQTPYVAWEGAGVAASKFNEQPVHERMGRPLILGASARAGRSDLYAARNGDLYRRDGGAWQRYDRGGWKTGGDVGTGGGGGGLGPPPEIRAAQRSRSWGTNRSSQFRHYRSSRGRSTANNNTMDRAPR